MMNNSKTTSHGTSALDIVNKDYTTQTVDKTSTTALDNLNDSTNNMVSTVTTLTSNKSNPTNKSNPPPHVLPALDIVNKDSNRSKESPVTPTLHQTNNNPNETTSPETLSEESLRSIIPGLTTEEFKEQEKMINECGHKQPNHNSNNNNNNDFTTVNYNWCNSTDHTRKGESMGIVQPKININQNVWEKLVQPNNKSSKLDLLMNSENERERNNSNDITTARGGIGVSKLYPSAVV